jgi:hypothetical protein
MNEFRANDVARPAKASSARRRTWFGQVPPWIEERVAREARIREHAEAVGFPPPLKPDSKAFARSLDPVLDRFHDEIDSRRDEPIPF